MKLCNNEEQNIKNTTHNKKLTIDETIFIKISQNDIKAFEEFYQLTERSVYAFVLSMLKNHDDALDIVQDVYVKIRTSAHLYKPMGKPMAWVFTIAKNLSISFLRSKTQFTNLQSENIEDNLKFSYIENKEDKLILEAVFKILNDKERQIIMLHTMSGLTYKEIAKFMNLPISTVLSKYHRSLKKIKKYFSAQEALYEKI